MITVRRTAAVGAAGALAVGIAVSGLGIGSAGAATYPPVTPTPTNPGTFKCSAKAVNGKDNIRVKLTATGPAANYKDYVFKIQKYLKNQQAWQVNNILYNIKVGESRVVDREAGRYRAKCFGPANAAVNTNRVRLTK